MRMQKLWLTLAAVAVVGAVAAGCGKSGNDQNGLAPPPPSEGTTNPDASGSSTIPSPGTTSPGTGSDSNTAPGSSGG